MRREVRFPSWAWWIIGATTVLAVAILVFSVVLGIRAGQEQVELQRRQRIGIALQQAIDLQAEGNLEAALDEYQQILLLDADNLLAQQAIQQLLAARTPEPAALATAPPPQPTATSPASPLAAATPGALATDWENAQRAARAGRWQEVLTLLLQLQQQNPTYQSSAVAEMLFTTYINLALEKDNVDDLEGALAWYDKALTLRPEESTVVQERQLITQYLDVLAADGVEWGLRIRKLQDLYSLDPDYRDVADRLHQAHVGYADSLASDEAWCLAQDEYNEALMVASTPTVVTKRDAAQTQCQRTGPAAPDGAADLLTGMPTSGPAPALNTSGGPTTGQLYYSADDSVSGRSQILVLSVKTGTSQLLLQDAAQPALRGDGTRLAYRNLRNDLSGISSYDPGSGLQLRFTHYAEDAFPSWAPTSQLVFASTREGDRRWRIYVTWAEENSRTEVLAFGEAPHWHPTENLIVYRGCDQSGNRCGLWTSDSSGGNLGQLTATPADDRPQWSPTGSYVAFMSDARDGNYEIYRVDTSSREVIRLTDHPALDVLPTVSPDGRWIAFASNRDGSWKIYAVASSGGEVYLVGSVAGNLSNLFDHRLQWGE